MNEEVTPKSPHLRLGIVGCGLVALAVHLKNLPRLRRVALVGVAEPDALKRQRAAQVAPGIRAVDSYDAILQDPHVDAVIVSVPYQEHAAVTLRALQAGKHVYLEKPFTTDLADAAEVRNFWARSGLVGTMGFNYRFHPLVAALHHAIAQGRVGDTVSIQISFSFPPHGGVDWDITRHGAFGALYDLAPHAIDTARYLTGSEVEGVTANTRSLHSPQDTAALMLRMANGVSVQAFLSTNCIEEHRIAVIGTDGKLTADLYRTPRIVHSGRKAAGRRIGRAFEAAAGAVGSVKYIAEKLRSPWHEPSFLRALRQFTETACEGRTLSPTFEDGYRGQLVVAAALQSARSGELEVGLR